MAPSSSDVAHEPGPVELRVRPLSPQEYAWWHTARGPDLGLPVTPGTTEVGVLVYARTGPVANVLVRAEPGARLTAELRALDVAEPTLTGAVVEAVVESFRRGGYSHMTSSVAGGSPTEPFTAAGFEVSGHDLVLPLAASADRRRPKGRSRLARRDPEHASLEEAGETDVASMVAWLGSARTTRALPRTPARVKLRELLDRPEEHVLVLRGSGATVADVWVTRVEVPAGSDGPDDSDGSAGKVGSRSVRSASVNAVRLRGGFSERGLDAVVAALAGWGREHGLTRLDVHLPVTADRRLLTWARGAGWTVLSTTLERTDDTGEADGAGAGVPATGPSA